ncbi:MAG: hypothetical protein ACRCVJ_18685 [Clostridium sp.]|uniref:hypothetical protein n=1 Tax=Clostridium sp. TaxID=1506 RepID=UPI003F303497
MQYGTITAIQMLSLRPNLVFQRVGDEKFEIYRDEVGRLMCRINGGSARTLQLFNYMHEKWKEKNI